MVKTPRTRHSKESKQPVTIDLEAESVASKADDGAGVSAETGMAEEEPAAADSSGKPGETDMAERKEKGDGAAAAPEAPADEPRKRASSTVGLIAAGLIGGALALSVAAGLSWSELWPGTGGETTSLREEMSALRSDIQAGLDAAGDQARTVAQEAAAAAVADAIGRIDAIAGDFDALTGELAEIRTAVEAGAGGDAAAVQALGTRIAAIEARVEELAAAPPPAVDSTVLDGLRARLDEFGGQIGKIEEGNSANAAAIETLTEELAALSRRVDQQAGNPKVAIAIAAAALKSAIDRGLPFMSELETYASVVPGAPEIEALRAMAARGVPTRADIAAGMDETANQMIAAVNTPDENAGFLERLLSSAQSLIQVRPIGMVEGDSAAAIVARMEVAVRENDYARALAEFDTLPEKARSAGESFAAKIAARMKADELIDKALAAALVPANG